PEITRHLREYFAEAGPNLPPWLRFGLRWLPRDGFAGRLVARAARSNAERLARRFIAASELAGVLTAIARMRRQSLAFSIDRLGEAVITEAEAKQYQQGYLELLAGLGSQVNRWQANDLIDRDDRGPLPRVNVSIKLSSLYSQFDPIDPEGTSAAVRARLRPVLRAARQQPAFATVDMDEYAFQDL